MLTNLSVKESEINAENLQPKISVNVTEIRKKTATHYCIKIKQYLDRFYYKACGRYVVDTDRMSMCQDVIFL